MSINPLAYGQQFILQAPQPQARPIIPQMTSPFMMEPPIPMLQSSPLADIFSRQDDAPPALSKPGMASEDNTEKPAADIESKPLSTGDDSLQPVAGNNAESSADNIVVQDTTVDIAGPIILNLKSTTKDDLTIMAGQDLADLLKAAGPELMDAMKKTKEHEKSKKGPDKGKFDSGEFEKDKFDGKDGNSDKLTIQEPPAALAPIEPTPISPKMAGFNTLG